MEKFVHQSAVKGYHAYRDRWDPVLGEILDNQRELDNLVEKPAVAVYKGSGTVGYILREIFKTVWHFIKHSGEVQIQITERHHHSQIAGG